MSYDPALFINPARAAEVAAKIIATRSCWVVTIKPQYIRGALQGYALLCFNEGDSFIATEDMVRKYG